MSKLDVIASEAKQSQGSVKSPQRLVFRDDILMELEDAPLPDRWIVSRLHSVTEKVLVNAEKYRLNDCMTAIYDFVWKEYCDWYLELVKVRLADDQPLEIRCEALGRAVTVFGAALRLLHPGMPFITEEMWQGIRNATESLHPVSGGGDGVSIMTQPYPQPADFRNDSKAEKEFGFLQRLIAAIRNIRAEMTVPPSKMAGVVIAGCSNKKRELVKVNIELVKRLATLSDITFESVRPPQSAAAVIDEAEVYVPLAGLIDIDVERKRLDKEIARLRGVIRGAESKLSNDKFISKAPEDVITHEKEKLANCPDQLVIVEKNRAVLD